MRRQRDATVRKGRSTVLHLSAKHDLRLNNRLLCVVLHTPCTSVTCTKWAD